MTPLKPLQTHRTFEEVVVEVVRLCSLALEGEELLGEVYLSSPKPGHTTGASGRHGAQRTAARGEARQNRVPTFRSARKATIPLALQGTVNDCSERLFASTNKGNPM